MGDLAGHNPVTWDQLQVGAVAAPQVDEPLTITDFVRYQGASGDMNPIHHDQAFARKAGYDQPIAIGMLAAGRAAAYLTDWLGPQNIRVFGVRFMEVAWPGDVLAYAGKVTGRREPPGERLVDVEIACTRQAGGEHLTAWATVVVHS
jgi:acyl dehydratase